MRTEDIPRVGPSDWQPITDKPTLALLGKLAEEAAELSGIIARCIIQGLDGKDPDTGRLNYLALADEIADVRGLSNLTVNEFRFIMDEHKIAERSKLKYDYKKTWIDELKRQRDHRELAIGRSYECIRDGHALVKRGEPVRFLGPYDGAYDALEFVAPNGHIVHLKINDVGAEVIP